jgi:hypothetical protein
MIILLRAIYRFNVVPFQNPSDILHRNRNISLKIHGSITSEDLQTSIAKKSNAGGITILCYSNKNSMVVSQNRQVDQWNKIEH